MRARTAIERDAAVAAEQVGFAVDQASLVTAFPESAAAAMAVVDAAHVAAAQRLHHVRHPRGGDRRHQQVDVVGHQHAGVHRAAFMQRNPAQVAEVTVMVGVGEETRLPGIAALDDMLRNAGKAEPGPARHVLRDVEWGARACCGAGDGSAGQSRLRMIKTAL